MNSKQDLLLESISKFFLNNRSNVDLLLEIIEGKYTSLRLIDRNENFKVYTSYK